MAGTSCLTPASRSVGNPPRHDRAGHARSALHTARGRAATAAADVSVLVAIEASTDAGSVAIGNGGELSGEVMIGTRTRHAESLLPALDFLLRSSRTPKSAIAGVIVGSGPGSFTGVRVAAATARGLAHALGVPLYAWSSLAALALESRETGAVCALFDARRGEVYAACYDRSAGSDRLTTLMEPDVLTVSALQQRVSGFAPSFVGEGANRYAHE